MSAVPFILGLCVGVIITGIIADKTNKAQAEKLQSEISRLQDAVEGLAGSLESLNTVNELLDDLFKECQDGGEEAHGDD